MPRRIAIIKPSALGDIVHALPVLTALRERFPDAHITWVVNRGFEPLLVGHPHLNATLAFDRAAFRKLGSAVRYSLGFVNRLRRERFDLVIDLQGLLRTGLMCAATGSPVKVGFANAREGAARFYTHAVEVPDADRIHAVDRYWRIAELLGCRSAKRFIVPLRESEVDAVHRELATLPRPWLAVAAGAKWVTKRWPPAHFATLLTKAQREFGGTVLLVGAAEDNALSAEIASQLRGPVRDFTGKTSLPKLAAVFAAADVMVGNDTGPLHLAAALGRPCVAPYTCTQVKLHGPYSSANTAVETGVPCAGSYLKKCPNGMVCFADLTPEKLWPPLAEVLTTWQRRISHSA
ncbi:glycosyltransferase family 9 protein [Limnoglobus roseus]|uniref:GT9 family glycosyltransferase n=1 Tax=Limnoglobus roseus TaxID=2598579 RepID=A0A5C1A3U2_9BACT|nr:glycosyltransferase family 9 protein [Limnoglobus roseus]QEL13749.1 GT9 family glycosyltransferase [Limnoglobus roseus]